MSSSNSKHRVHTPIGDIVEASLGLHSGSTGYARALQKWEETRTRLSGVRRSSLDFKSCGLSLPQLHSLRILEEWWDARTQQKGLTEAALKSIKTAAEQDSEAKDGWAGLASRSDALLSESTYHGNMFILFEFEFVFEARRQMQGNLSALSDVLRYLRTKCSKFAALQRVAHAIINETLFPREHDENAIFSGTSFQEELDRTIPVCVQPCAWLHETETDTFAQKPHFLWDVANRCTVVVNKLSPPPQYVCVSHTWGRWLKNKEPPIRVFGVNDWLVPQNSRFEVSELPEQLHKAFHSGYVWLDLLCIPQDGSALGNVEISRQATIFQNASAVVAWMTDVRDWQVLCRVVRWFGLFYLHTNVNLQKGEAAFPDMPQHGEAAYPGMELYDWTTGEVSSMRIVEGKPIDENTRIAAPLPWFTSLWTLQEACLRPDLIFCDRSWRPLILYDNMVTLDTLVTLEAFVSQNEFAKSVTRPSSEKPPGFTLPSMSFAEIEKPEGCRDLTTLLIDTHLSSVMNVNAAAIFAFGQLRQSTSRRDEAIMSAVGSTEWYLKYVEEHGKPPPESDLVQDLYPLQFVQESARKVGATFFTCLPTELRYLEQVVDLSTGNWQFRSQRVAAGSMLPFSRTSGYMLPPVAPTQTEYPHPTVSSWTIAADGSVHITKAGILTIDTSQQNECFIHGPLYDEEDKIHYDTQLEMVDKVDLGGWLDDFQSPEYAPNFAVSLFQTPKLRNQSGGSTNAGGGTHTGLLLKCCGWDTSQSTMYLVKVGLFFTNSIDIQTVPSFEVNWVVL